MRKLLLLLILLFAVRSEAQTNSNPANPLGGNVNLVDAGTCSTYGSYFWQKLPLNASTTTVNLAGTFSGTVTVRESNNGGGTWTTAGTQTGVGTSSYTTNGFTDVCADVTTYASGIIQITVTTGVGVNNGGSSSSSGLTPVATLPGTCTAGQQFQLPNGAIVTCGPSANQFSSSSPLFINVLAYGVTMNWNVCTDGSWTNTSSQITSAGQCTWTSVDLGKTIFVTTACSSGLPPTTLELTDAATIATITSAHVIQVTGATTTGANAGGGCIAYGSGNEDTGWSAVDTAVAAAPGCPYVFIPAGLSGVIHAHLYTQPPGCHLVLNGFGLNEQGMVVAGVSKSLSKFIIRPSLAPSTECVHGKTSHACFVAVEASTWHDLGFDGVGNDRSGQTDTGVSYFEFDDYAAGRDLAWINYSSNDSGSFGVNEDGCCDVELSRVISDGFGRQNFVNNMSVPSNLTVRSSLFCDGLGGVGAPYWLNNGFMTVYDSYGCGNLGTVVGQQYIENVGGATMHFTGGGCFNNGASANASCILNQGTLYIQDAVLQGFTGGFGLNQQGKAYMRNVTTIGPGGSVLQSAGTNPVIVDYGGNILNSAASISTGSVLLSESATGTALVTTNIGLTSGWSSSSVSSVGANSDSHSGVFTVTAAGTPTAGPTLTLTFPTPYPFVAPRYCNFTQIGGTLGVLTIAGNGVGTPSTTSVLVTFGGAAVAAQTYTFSYGCF